MIDTLLRELTNSDLDWLMASGERQQLLAGQALALESDSLPRLAIVIEGRLGLMPTHDHSPGKPDLANGDDLEAGNILGVRGLFDPTEPTIITPLEPVLLLWLPLAKVREKMADDVAFAAHFYRAIAVMLADRLRGIFQQPGQIRLWAERSAKDVLSVFSELRDSDVDWLVSFGHLETLSTDRVLLQAGRPVDALTILLEGQLAISAPSDTFNPLYLCFSGSETSTRGQPVFATLAKGSMPGISSFLNFHPLPVTIRTVQESLVFKLPRQLMTTKLQTDDSFASRFYRVIARQTLELLQVLETQGSASPGQGESLADEELDLEDLQQMSEGAKKFGWMLSQLGVNSHG